ncbi:23S rRNA (pseudouridine(1915)-N(3))-methyltransferase RlmH [Carnobacterium sp. PL12RED10]|uniref:23S rRNA (pseudouridine(1915)-N(3))-methyltransferase RlmH n=1 Tax=Carnobacterium sp. PL12RED10 TaxID=2592351 RepID=UPI000EBF4CB6|nr:23S rRNA (pseudouridine(1915)-N(3))-methyltransferase RlmH [Carnobacterium sp. PL12RED10]KAF3299187.1 23S rRNA (pseudouridine(1915)-N(3))-methyltransferase RlmH [Carnobacterium sp. PL12RED10]HCT97355.1 23S rRNA (pseudouridine(1915)-N(3))-methyltransferase RlmH [Aerococcus urinaeequi]
MLIKIISVGKLKEKYLKQGIEEYAKRLSRYTKFEIIEVKDEPTKENASEAEDEMVKNAEGERILSKIKADDFVYLLAINGQMLSSLELAKSMQVQMTQGKSTLVFVIGGSLGTSDAVNKRANQAISFGKMTLPHQLMRLVLTEQIYRAFRIQNNEPYHK